MPNNVPASIDIILFLQAIQEKIKQLDFQDCKVRVLNVDAQASFENILISVIGEISNKQEPSRKFVQTFVLAEQPNGYYVLNDVFRYLADEEEVTDEAAVSDNVAEEPELQAPAQTAVETTPEAEDSKVDSEVAAAKVDEKLEDVEGSKAETPAAAEPTPQTNGTEKNEPAAEAAEEPAATAEAESLKPEQPATPKSTPAPPVQKEAQAPAKEPAAPSKALPKTWANIASKVGATAPVVPAIPAAPAKSAAATSTAPQPAAPAPAAATAAAAAAPATTAAPVPESVPSQPSSTDGSGWQTAGHDHKKSQARSGDNQAVLGYIKNVTEKVNADLLRETLERFGKLTHFDVSRQKVSSFHYSTMKCWFLLTSFPLELCFHRIC